MKISEISREELKNLYIDQNKTDKEISYIYGGHLASICALRKKYGIAGINARHRELKDNPHAEITNRQKSIIFGSLLGDACLKTSRGCKNSMLSISHSDKQREYLWWIYEELKTICNREPTEYLSKGQYITIEMKTRFREDLSDIRNKIYTPKKTVNDWWLDKINDLSLAIWYMDDGSLLYVNKTKSIFSFATNSFSMKENYLLSNIMKSKFGIETEIKPINRKDSIQYNLIVSDSSFSKFNDIISSYIINCMRYKLPGRIHNEKLLGNIEGKITKEKLEELYCGKKLGQIKIGNLLGVHKLTISKYMDLFEIKARSNEEAEKAKKDSKDSGMIIQTANEEEKSLQIFKELRKSGFSYPKEKNKEHYIGIIDTLCNSYICKKEDNVFGYSRAGMIICYSLCPQIFSMAANGSKSPIDIFRDDDVLLDCIKRSIKYVKEDYISTIMQEIKTYRNNSCVPIFPPMWSKAILREICQGKSGLSVLDFSCGFAGRLLGSYASGVIGSYTGIDPINSNIISHEKIGKLIKEHSSMRNKDFKMKFICGFAEETIKTLYNKFDIVISSPYYFSKEIYDSSISQCYIKYPHYEEWKEAYMTSVLRDSYEKLNIGGSMIIFANDYETYIEHRFGDDCRDIIKEISGKDPSIYKFIIPELRLFRSKGSKRYDIAFIVTKI